MPLIFGLIIGSTLAATTDQWWWTTVAVIVAAGIAVAGCARTAKRDHS